MAEANTKVKKRENVIDLRVKSEVDSEETDKRKWEVKVETLEEEVTADLRKKD